MSAKKVKPPKGVSKPDGHTASKGDALAGLMQFGFEGEPVRMVMEGEMPWFNAEDVCEALGFLNPRQALVDHVDEEDRNSVRNPDGKRGNPNRNFVNESGLYALIFGSGKPKAKRFKRWVTSEVLPSIRRTGRYRAGDSTLPAPAKQDDEFALTPAFFARLYYALGKQLGPAAVVWHLARLGSLQDWVTISFRDLSRGMDHAVGTSTIHRQTRALVQQGLLEMEQEPTRFRLNAPELHKLIAAFPETDDMRPGLALVELGLVTLH
ncbi:MAG: BRO family protein [Thiobacillaceae bacterium]